MQGIGENAQALAVIMSTVAIVAIVWIVSATLYYRRKTMEREQTRREIAAYVAEGTMSPADAARLIEAAGNADKETDC